MKNIKALDRCILLVILLCVLSCNSEQLPGSNESGSTGGNSIVGFFTSSKKEALEFSDYKLWVENAKNGLVAEKKINDIVFKCLYKPNEYEALLRLRNKTYDPNFFHQTKTDIEHLQFFTLKIQTADNQGELLKHELSSTDEYYRRIEFCSFHMQNSIKLIDAGDTLNCVLFHFERVFNIAPEATFVLGFEDHRSKENKKKGLFNGDKIIRLDDGIFNSGIVNLGISNESLNKIPELNTAIN